RGGSHQGDPRRQQEFAENRPLPPAPPAGRFEGREKVHSSADEKALWTREYAGRGLSASSHRHQYVFDRQSRVARRNWHGFGIRRVGRGRRFRFNRRRVPLYGLTCHQRWTGPWFRDLAGGRIDLLRWTDRGGQADGADRNRANRLGSVGRQL